MLSKFEMFNELPPEIKVETAQNLLNRDLVNLAQTSKYHSALFKPLIDVRKLLFHVTRGKHDVVKAMLKQDMNLLFKRGNVTDCSLREFENISGFEYALWALDKHMWAAMIESIPSNEKGKKVFAKLIAQYNKFNTDGVTYRLNGTAITEKHFDFENTIIKELQTQVDLVSAPAKNWEAINKQWQEGVGGAQMLLPMHVVYEYCSVESFHPVPKFTSQPESSIQFYNEATDNNENWFGVDSKLSVNFAIFKCRCPLRPAAGGWLRARAMEVGRRCMRDLIAMTALCKVRANDFIDLKSQLADQMTLIRCLKNNAFSISN